MTTVPQFNGEMVCIKRHGEEFTKEMRKSFPVSKLNKYKATYHESHKAYKLDGGSGTFSVINCYFFKEDSLDFYKEPVDACDTEKIKKEESRYSKIKFAIGQHVVISKQGCEFSQYMRDNYPIGSELIVDNVYSGNYFTLRKNKQDGTSYILGFENPERLKFDCQAYRFYEDSLSAINKSYYHDKDLKVHVTSGEIPDDCIECVGEIWQDSYGNFINVIDDSNIENDDFLIAIGYVSSRICPTRKTCNFIRNRIKTYKQTLNEFDDFEKVNSSISHHEYFENGNRIVNSVIAVNNGRSVTTAYAYGCSDSKWSKISEFVFHDRWVYGKKIPKINVALKDELKGSDLKIDEVYTTEYGNGEQLLVNGEVIHKDLFEKVDGIAIFPNLFEVHNVRILKDKKEVRSVRNDSCYGFVGNDKESHLVFINNEQFVWFNIPKRTFHVGETVDKNDPVIVIYNPHFKYETIQILKSYVNGNMEVALQYRGSPIAVGDEVLVLNGDKKPLGFTCGWADMMDKLIGNIYKVEKINYNGSISIRNEEYVWSMPPSLLKKVVKEEKKEEFIDNRRWLCVSKDAGDFQFGKIYDVYGKSNTHVVRSPNGTTWNYDQFEFMLLGDRKIAYNNKRGFHYIHNGDPWKGHLVYSPEWADEVIESNTKNTIVIPNLEYARDMISDSGKKLDFELPNGFGKSILESPTEFKFNVGEEVVIANHFSYDKAWKSKFVTRFPVGTKAKVAVRKTEGVNGGVKIYGLEDGNGNAVRCVPEEDYFFFCQSQLSKVDEPLVEVALISDEESSSTVEPEQIPATVVESGATIIPKRSVFSMGKEIAFNVAKGLFSLVALCMGLIGVATTTIMIGYFTGYVSTENLIEIVNNLDEQKTRIMTAASSVIGARGLVPLAFQALGAYIQRQVDARVGSR